MRYFTILLTFLMLNFFGNNHLQAQKQKPKTKIHIKTKKTIQLSGSARYIIIKENNKNAFIKTGDFISFHITVKNSKDSILGTTYEAGVPALQEVMTTGKSGGFEDVLLKLHKGDSAVIWVNSDSLVKQIGRPLPSFIAKGSELEYTITIIDIMNKAQAEEMAEKINKEAEIKQKELGKAQIAIDEKIIVDYIKKNNLKAENIGNGIYYVRTTEGVGATPKTGDTVVANYTGKTIKGEVFDSSLTNGQPFEFAVGTGMVIRGWDEGFLKMKKGGKGTLFIPSGMAYGGQSPTPMIKPFSVLIFDVELLKIIEKK